MAKKKDRPSATKPLVFDDQENTTTNLNDQITDFEMSSETKQVDLHIADDRTDERQSASVHAVIQIKESETEFFKEIVDVSEISKNGAGFTLERECGIGRLVSMVIDMPIELRVYDFDEDIYPVLGVVQTCYPTKVDGKDVFRVGVAFIGKDLPDGFRSDPRQCYRLTGKRADGLWETTEAPREFKRRKYSRFWRQFDVSLLLRDEATRTSHKVVVSSRDISASGISVWGEIDAEIGDRVKITSQDYDFFAMAVLINKVPNEKEPARSSYHFQFEGGAFPVERLHINPETMESREVAQDLNEEVAEQTEVSHVFETGQESDLPGEIVKY